MAKRDDTDKDDPVSRRKRLQIADELNGIYRETGRKPRDWQSSVNSLFDRARIADLLAAHPPLERRPKPDEIRARLNLTIKPRQIRRHIAEIDLQHKRATAK